ncbi:MAG: hypothetical protein QM479_00025 [Pseudomonadota bacterium]
MGINFQLDWFFFFILFIISDVIAAPMQLAAIDITLVQEKKQNSYQIGKKSDSDENSSSVIKNTYSDKAKIVMPENKVRAIEGYRTTTDKKGRKSTEYVHGEIVKGSKGIYTGYLYGKNNKKTFVYGDPSRGTMQADDNGDFQMEAADGPKVVEER